MGAKKVAFVLPTFVVGGVEKSFLDLLDVIDRDQIDVTIYLTDDKGEWTEKLMERGCVKFLRIESWKDTIVSQLKKGNILGAFRSLGYRILARMLYKNKYRKSTEFFIKSMPREQETFDCVIAYQIINDECLLGALYRLKARKRVAWSHAYIHKTEPLYAKWYSEFDQIVCVSNYVRNAFVSNFPQLCDRTLIVHNVLNKKRILELSNEEIALPEKDYSTFLIVTVGRLSKEKGQLLIPKAARLLLDAGYSFQWLIIGDGDLRNQLENSVEHEGVQCNVILLGSIENPYPYMRACDLYVQTSLTEGWGLTVSEAKILGKPIVTTNAGVMHEQLTDRIDGRIVSEASSEALAKAILELLGDAEQRDRYVDNLIKKNYYDDDLNEVYKVLSP